MCVLRRAGTDVTFDSEQNDQLQDTKESRSLSISNVRLVDASGVRDGAYRVSIYNGTIRDITPMSVPVANRPTETEEIDAGGRTLMPAFIDLHAHFRDPGFPDKETIESGSCAALAGGYTTVSVMANTRPVCDCVEVASDVVARAEAVGLVNVIPVGAITHGLAGKELADLDQLSAIVWAFSDDGYGVQSLEIAERAFEAAARLKRPIFEHCETDGVDDPDRSEEMMAERDIQLAARFGTRLHIAHVRSPRTQALVERARERGVAVSCEVTPHHLCLDQELGYRVNPPLGGGAARAVLVRAVQTGQIDAIATDHAPHTREDKANGAPGISGIETAFSLLYTELVKPGALTLVDLSRAMSAGPARLLGLQDRRGFLRPGTDADLVLIDERASWRVTEASLQSRGKNTPLLGRTLRGRVWATIRGGNVMVHDRAGGGQGR